MATPEFKNSMETSDYLSDSSLATSGSFKSSNSLSSPSSPPVTKEFLDNFPILRVSWDDPSLYEEAAKNPELIDDHFSEAFQKIASDDARNQISFKHNKTDWNYDSNNKARLHKYYNQVRREVKQRRHVEDMCGFTFQKTRHQTRNFYVQQRHKRQQDLKLVRMEKALVNRQNRQYIIQEQLQRAQEAATQIATDIYNLEYAIFQMKGEEGKLGESYSYQHPPKCEKYVDYSFERQYPERDFMKYYYEILQEKQQKKQQKPEHDFMKYYYQILHEKQQKQQYPERDFMKYYYQLLQEKQQKNKNSL